MKFQICFLSIVAVGALIACSSSPKPAVVPAQTTNVATVQKDTLITPKQRYSYALGMDMGHALKNVDADIDEEILLRSIRDQMDGKTPMMSDSDAQKSLQELLVQIQQKKEQKTVEAAKKALDDQKAFLEKNKKDSGVVTTASGLQYKIIKQGNADGKTPKSTDKVKVHYVGALMDGTEFDSSRKRGEPLEFPVNAVIQGWQELLTLMKEGMEVKAWIPSNLGYGAEGASPVIPANALLVFDVELLNVLPTDSVAVKPVASQEVKADTVNAVKKTAKELKAEKAAADKAKADSVKAAKATADSLKKVQAKAKADSVAAVKAADKAKADSVKAAKVAADKAKADSVKTAKATADSLKNVQAKAKQDSIAAAKAAPKAEAKKDTATAAPAKK
jgi:FKBP-type peptidyl-prolyl cis-trans isomerase